MTSRFVKQPTANVRASSSIARNGSSKWKPEGDSWKMMGKTRVDGEFEGDAADGVSRLAEAR